MASAAYNTLQLLHVVGAMVVVGYLAVIPMWRSALQKDAEPNVLRAFLGTLASVQTRVVLPAIGLLFVTGLLMVVGPLAEGVPLQFSRMSQAGIAIALIFGFIVWNGLGQPAKKMLALVEKGEHQGPAMDKLWSDWRTALMSASLLALVATGLMVFLAPN